MLKRTHTAIGLVVGLYFLSFVTYKFSFIPIVLLSSLLPDIDSMSSSIGQRKIFRPVQVVLKHRGVLHSFTFCALISLVFAFFYPIIALPFFLGYASHLFADSFTVAGIRPFWPLKSSSSGIIKTGGVTDKMVFGISLIVSVFLFILLFSQI